MAIPVMFNTGITALGLGLSLAVAAPPLPHNGDNSPTVSIVGDNSDADGDELTRQEENLYGTDPDKADTDGDGLRDGTEIALELNPLAKQTQEGFDDTELDSDEDGYSNLEEQTRGYGPADPYDSPAMPGWPRKDNWADGSARWHKSGPEKGL